MTKCPKCNGIGWLFWNDKIKYFCKTQEDGCKDTLYKCDMCWGGDREIEHHPIDYVIVFLIKLVMLTALALLLAKIFG